MHSLVAGRFEGQGDHHTPKPYVRQTFRKYLECVIFAHGVARARCDDCGYDYFVAYSCKGRGVCTSCNTRHMMVEAAAHLTDKSHAIEPLRLDIPDRSRPLGSPKRVTYLPHVVEFQSMLGFHSAIWSVAGLAPCSRRCQCSIRHVRSSARVTAACTLIFT